MYKFRKGINFAKNIEKYYKKEKIFTYLRQASIALTLITTFSVFILVWFNLRSSLQIRELAQRRRDLLNSFLERSIESEKLLVISDKIKFMKSLLENKDARFLLYYRTIEDIVKRVKNESTSSAAIQIDNFELDNNRNTKFELTSTDFNSYLQLLDFIDEAKFLNLFENLTLTNFSLTKGEENNSYSLKFKGKFKRLDYEEK